jgi:hypothetical protein
LNCPPAQRLLDLQEQPQVPALLVAAPLVVAPGQLARQHQSHSAALPAPQLAMSLQLTAATMKPRH